MGGYRSRANDLLKNYEGLLNEIEQAERDLTVFE